MAQEPNHENKQSEDDETIISKMYRLEPCQQSAHSQSCSSALCLRGSLFLKPLTLDKYLSEVLGNPLPYFRAFKAVRARGEAPTPVGLSNFGATCYMNSCIQSLFHNLTFRTIVCGNAGNTRKTPAAELAFLFGCMEQSVATWIKPVDFVKQLNLQPNVQQDAEEFWNLLVTSLLGTFYPPEVQATFTKMFEGAQLQHVQCGNCSNENIRAEKLYGVGVDIQTVPTVVTTFKEDRAAGNQHLVHTRAVQSLLSQFFQPEQIEGYSCEKCKQVSTATKYYTLKKIPDILPLHIKRFVYDVSSYQRHKLKDYISFPKQLDMTSWCQLDCSTNKEGEPQHLQYELTSVVRHIGETCHQGHFIVDTFSKQHNCWFTIDDIKTVENNMYNRGVNSPAATININNSKCDDTSKVPSQFTSDELIHSNEAYLLIYTRKGIPSPPTVPPPNTTTSRHATVPYWLQQEIESENNNLKQQMSEFQSAKKEILNTFHQHKDQVQRWKNPTASASPTALDYLCIPNSPTVAHILREKLSSTYPFYFIHAQWFSVYCQGWWAADSVQEVRVNMYNAEMVTTRQPPTPPDVDEEGISEEERADRIQRRNQMESDVKKWVVVPRKIPNDELVCAHGKVSPTKVGYRVISKAVWEHVHQLFGGLQLDGTSICYECLAAHKADQEKSSQQHQELMRMHAVAVTSTDFYGIKSVENNNNNNSRRSSTSSNSGNDEAKDGKEDANSGDSENGTTTDQPESAKKQFWVRKDWIHRWIQAESRHVPDGWAEGLLCKHNNLNSMQIFRILIPEEVWCYLKDQCQQQRGVIMQDLPHDAPECPHCRLGATATLPTSNQQETEEITKQQKQRQTDKNELKSILEWDTKSFDNVIVTDLQAAKVKQEQKFQQASKEYQKRVDKETSEFEKRKEEIRAKRAEDEKEKENQGEGDTSNTTTQQQPELEEEIVELLARPPQLPPPPELQVTHKELYILPKPWQVEFSEYMTLYEQHMTSKHKNKLFDQAPPKLDLGVLLCQHNKLHYDPFQVADIAKTAGKGRGQRHASRQKAKLQDNAHIVLVNATQWHYIKKNFVVSSPLPYPLEDTVGRVDHTSEDQETRNEATTTTTDEDGVTSNHSGSSSATGKKAKRVKEEWEKVVGVSLLQHDLEQHCVPEVCQECTENRRKTDQDRINNFVDASLKVNWVLVQGKGKKLKHICSIEVECSANDLVEGLCHKIYQKLYENNEETISRCTGENVHVSIGTSKCDWIDNRFESLAATAIKSTTVLTATKMGNETGPPIPSQLPPAVDMPTPPTIPEEGFTGSILVGVEKSGDDTRTDKFGWVCEFCTFKNGWQGKSCDICGNLRNNDVNPPLDLQVNSPKKKEDSSFTHMNSHEFPQAQRPQHQTGRGYNRRSNGPQQSNQYGRGRARAL